MKESGRTNSKSGILLWYSFGSLKRIGELSNPVWRIQMGYSTWQPDETRRPLRGQFPSFKDKEIIFAHLIGVPDAVSGSRIIATERVPISRSRR
jgi:hypothetical protein